MSGGQAQKKQSFLQGVAVLTAATIIVKLLGFIYKVPLQNILQERGFGYFNTAYDVYNVLLMISTTGLPVAVSRMISQAQALDNYAQIRKIYSVSMKVFLTIGVVGTLIMLVFCRQLSVMVTTNENSWAAIAALSPCVLLICIVSAHRGFFQGQSNMTPTSVSQIFEAIIRLVVGLSLAWLLMRETGSATYAAAGGILGVTVATSLSAILSIVLLVITSKRYLPEFAFFSCRKTMFKCAAALLACAGGVVLAEHLFAGVLLRTAMEIVFGCGFYGAALILLRCQELTELFKDVKNKLRKSGD